MHEETKNSPDWAITAWSLLFNSCKKIELSDNTCRVAMAEWLEVRTSDSQSQDHGFKSRQKPVGSSKPSRVGYGWRQWCLGSLSCKWVPGYSMYRQRLQLYLDYPWHLEACERVYTPQGVEQVMDVTGLPGVIICKALWDSRFTSTNFEMCNFFK